MEESRMIPVQSRNGGIVFYTIPEDNIQKIFRGSETKMIHIAELKKLMSIPGGEKTIRADLIIKDRDALVELGISVEPEYFYTEKEILQILETGTLDELEDMLNFAPEGVINMVQQLSVKIELPDTRKRKMILEKTGFNVDGALQIKQIMGEDEEKEKAAAAPTRKATAVKKEEPAPVTRKAAPIAVGQERKITITASK